MLSRDYEHAQFYPLEVYRYSVEEGEEPETCEYDERYYQLKNFKTNEYIVQYQSGALDFSLANKPGYVIEDEDKEKTEYFFWARPTVEWSCAAAELEETFNALDSTIVFDNDLHQRSLLIFVFIEGAYHLAAGVLMLAGLCNSRVRYEDEDGNTEPGSHPLLLKCRQKQHHYWVWKFMFSMASAVTAFHFLVFSMWAVKRSELQVQNLQLISDRFGGQCTDVYTRFDFDLDLQAIEEQRLAAVPY